MPKQPPKIPTIHTDSVYHIGDLDIQKKGVRFDNSYEGHCLSISHCPAAWTAIAKLGGTPWYQLNKENGVFVDVLKTIKNKKWKNFLIVFGEENEYLKKETKFRAWNTDEDGEWRYFLFDNQQDALNELGIDAEDIKSEFAPDGSLVVEEMTVYCATQKLADKVKNQDILNQDCLDFLLMVWLEENLDVDGMWWNEVFDPNNLSAPRAGIFPNKLKEWEHVSILPYSVNDNGCQVSQKTSELDKLFFKNKSKKLAF